MAYKDKSKQKAFQQKWYLNNKSDVNRRSLFQKRKKRDYIAAVKDCPCMDCGIKYPPYVMDLDHRNKGDKVMNLAKFLSRAGWDRIKDEIKKCDVVCSNCHRERTAQRARIVQRTE